MAATLSGARTRTLNGDADADGQPDSGDTFLHTLIILNSGDESAFDIVVTETEEGLRIDPASVKIGPVAMDDVFNITGNTPVVITKAQLLNNDIDPDGDITAATIVNLSAGTNGTIVDNLDGTYTFTPTTGFNGVASFSYEVVDEDGLASVSGAETPGATAGLVTINVTGLVWYVNSTSGSDATGDGSYAKPFATVNPLTTGGSADGLDGAGDIIFLYGGAAVSGNLVLETNQKLYGDSVALTVNGFAIGETAGNSDLNGSGGFTVTLATGNEIDGIDIGGTAGITGTNFGTVTIANSTIDTSGQALSLNNGTVAGAGFTSTDSDGGTNNVSLTSVAGTLNLGSGALSGGTSGVFNVNGGTVSVTYNGTLTQSANAATVNVLNHTTGTLDFNGNVTATNGSGLQFNNADGTYRFDGAANSLNGGDAGIDITNGSTGTFVFDNLTLTHNANAGAAFTLQGSNANVTLNGTVTDNNGRALDIDDHDGGTMTINAAINSSTASGQGIRITDSAGTINFNGAIQLSTGANNAIEMTNNTGASFTFAPGGLGLDITTTSGRGFFIEGGGTVRLSGSGNTISTGSGRAVEIDNATIGSGGFTLQSVNMTGGSTTGIFINNAGTGGFTITGTGSDANSGGTIGSISGTTGQVENGIGIYLNNVSNVSLSNIQMNGTYGNFGIRGENVTNFTLRDSLLTGTFGDSDGQQEGAVRFGTQSTATNGLTGTGLFEGNTISNGFYNNLAVFNYGAGTLNMTVRDSANDQAVIGLNNTNFGNDGIFVETGGSSVLVLEVDGVTFSGAKADMLQVIAVGSTNQTLLIENNTFHNAHPDIIAGGGGITISGGGNTSNYTVDYTIQNNSLRGAEGSAMFISYAGLNGNASGRILNNTIGINDGSVGTTQATTGSNGSGAGIWVETQNSANGGAVNHAVRIEGNVIRDIVSSSTGAISLRANNVTTGSNRMEVTILNNNISELGNFNYGGIYAMVGGNGAGDNGRMGLDIRGNTINLSSFPNGGGQPDGNAIILDQLSDTAFYYVPGYAGSQDGEFALSGPAGTASANLSSFWTTAPRVNTLTNGQFPGFAGGGVDATIVEGLLGSNFVLAVPALAAHPDAPDWEAELRAVQQQAHEDYLASLAQADESDAGAGDTGGGGTTIVDLTPQTPAPAPDGGERNLSQAQLDALVEAAIARWEAAGATEAQLAAMRAATITVEDMAGLYLATSDAGAIRIDSDAAGRGWFVDSTPGDDSEFAGSGSRLEAAAGGPAAGRMDLLTVLVHELGHQAGLDDLYGEADRDEIMYGWAHLGERRLAQADDLAAADPAHVGHTSYVLALPEIDELPEDKAIRIVWQSTVDADPSTAAVDAFASEVVPVFQNFSTIDYTDSLGAGQETTANEALAIDTLSIGDLVFIDLNNNGFYDAGTDDVVQGVAVSLYADADNDGVPDGAAIATDTTDASGLYRFDNLAPGTYIVALDASNFEGAGALVGRISVAGGNDPDDDVDNDDNGVAGTGALAGAVVSAPVTLVDDDEAADDGTGDLDYNNTVDFGFLGIVAQDDAFTTDENTAITTRNVFEDNGNGADSGTTVTAVNGDSGDVGSEITLASGAKLTLNANGTFSYNPSGSFAYLISVAKAAATGAVNTNFVDTFTYELDGSDTATVTITINGIDGAGDHLRDDSGNNTINGTNGADLFVVPFGGDDILSGGLGDDIFYFADQFTDADQVNGGGGFDSIFLEGDYILTLGATTITGIEKIGLLSGGVGNEHFYSITTVDANVAAGERLLIDGQALLPGESLIFNGFAETNGRFRVLGGGCDDLIVGGAKNDELLGGDGNDIIYGMGGDDKITGGLGYDFLYGGAGKDIFFYASAAESTGVDFDTIDTFQPNIDKIDLPTAVTGWTGTIGTGQLDSATFDADLAAAVDAALQANSAVLFTPDSGDLAGRKFVVVDADGDGNYQVGVDYVFEFSNEVTSLTASSAFFI